MKVKDSKGVELAGLLRTYYAIWCAGLAESAMLVRTTMSIDLDTQFWLRWSRFPFTFGAKSMTFLCIADG